MIHTAKELAFIRFMTSCIKKNKRYGFCDLTNKELAERFIYQGRKFSESSIRNFISIARPVFHFEGIGRRRQIYLKPHLLLMQGGEA